MLSKGCVPKNTVKSNEGAQRVVYNWIAERNGRTSDNAPKCPRDLLENGTSGELNYWLSRFVTEVKKQNGDAYPPRTIHLLLAGLQRVMLERNPNAPKFLDRMEPYFGTFIVRVIVSIASCTPRE